MCPESIHTPQTHTYIYPQTSYSETSISTHLLLGYIYVQLPSLLLARSLAALSLSTVAGCLMTVVRPAHSAQRSRATAARLACQDSTHVASQHTRLEHPTPQVFHNIHTHTHTHTHTCTYICMYVCMYVCMHVCVCVYTYIHIYICMYVCM